MQLDQCVCITAQKASGWYCSALLGGEWIVEIKKEASKACKGGLERNRMVKNQEFTMRTKKKKEREREIQSKEGESDSLLFSGNFIILTS